MATNNKKRFDLESLDAKVREMEKLGLRNQDQKDWEDDARDPMEQTMVTKEKPFNVPRGRGNKRGKFRGHWKNRPHSGRGRGSSYGNFGNNSFDNMSMSGSERSSSSYNSVASSYGSFHSARSVDGFSPRSVDGFSPRNFNNYYDSDNMSDISSVSRRQTSFSEKLTASTLAKRLAEFDSFQATLLQLLDKFQIDHKQAERVARDNNQTFKIEAELLRLRPDISICSAYVNDGCTDREKCKDIHLCSKYVFGYCNEKDCCFGHFWLTDHNKRVFTHHNLNFLHAKQLSGLFKNFILAKAKDTELKICDKYNEGNCENKDCTQLHLCLGYLAKQCTEKDCKLSHNISDNNPSSILQMHGLSLNESPRDILLTVANIPSVKDSIDALMSQTSSSTSSNTDDKVATTDSVDKNAATETSDATAEGKVEDKNSKVAEEDVVIKTAWAHDLIGNVTLDEICYNSVENFCPFEESGCWRLHCALHFHWQVKATLGKKPIWFNLSEEQVLALEKAYCDPSISKIDLPLLDPLKFKATEKGLLLILKGKSKWEANFHTMELILTGKNEVLNLRRLYTEDTQNEILAPCTWKWYFSDKNKNWIEYGNIDSTGEEQLKCNINSQNIEKHFHSRSKSPLSFQNQSFSYTLDLKNMVQTNLSTNVARKVRRRPTPHLKGKEKKSNSDLPLTWDPMQPEERSKRVTIAPSSDEYKTLSSYVQTHAKNNSYNILKIERVQNLYVWKAFQNKIREMKAIYKNDATVDVRQLFHGTGPDIVPKICEENFDWRLHGTSAGQMYGRGTYFSSLSSYSYGYAKVDANGHRFMFVAKVAVGTTTAGNAGLSRPPINQQYGIPYDATVDNVSNPTVIVKYDKQEYYPEYIITFG